MLQAFANIFKIPDLRKKIYFTIGIIAIFRLGCYIPVPGIDVEALKGLFENAANDGGVAGNLLAIGRLFTGGAISNAAIFGLGVMPYISSSIIFQVLTVVVPSLQALSKEGEGGRKKIQQYVRLTTVGLAFFQAFIILVGLSQIQTPKIVSATNTTSFVILGSLIITAGCMLLMWLGEQIDEYGIGNGISMIIMVGIVARFFPAMSGLFGKMNWASPTGGEGQIGYFQIIFIFAFFIAMIFATVLITRGQRRIPIQQARRTRGNRVYGGQRTYLPIGVNMVNVIPIIFAQALFIVPNAIAAANDKIVSEESPIMFYLTYIFKFLTYGTFLYVLLYVLMIIFFSYFYAAITFKPDEVADRMKQYGNFIPGIRPGKQTENYLEKILTHVTMFGAFCLAGIAIVPMFAAMFLNIDYMVAGFFGGTGLLISVGVALDLMQKVESHLLMHNYEGFLKKGKMKGRRG